MVSVSKRGLHGYRGAIFYLLHPFPPKLDRSLEDVLLLSSAPQLLAYIYNLTNFLLFIFVQNCGNTFLLILLSMSFFITLQKVNQIIDH